MNKRVYWLIGLLVVALVAVVAYAAGAWRQPGGALEDREWVLISYGPKDALKTALSTTEATATFDSAEGRVAGKGSVNSYSGSYTVSGSTLTLTSPIVQTLMAGPQDAMDQESAFLRALQAAASYEVDGDVLEIATADGGLLVLEAR